MFPHAVPLLAFIVLTAFIPVFFVYLANDSRFSAIIKTYGGLNASFMTTVFLVFGLNLASLANEVWSARDRAVAAVATEGDVLRIIARLASGVKTPIGRDVVESLNRYERYTVTEEWPQLGQPGRAYGEAGGLGAVTVMIASDEMAAAVKPSVYTQIMAQMNTLRTARNTRYALSDSGLNPVKWAFVCFTEIVAMLTVGFGHLERKRAQILAFALFFAASTPTLAVLVIESNPFRGFVPVSSHPIEVALDHSTGLLAKMPPKRPTGAE